MTAKKSTTPKPAIADVAGVVTEMDTIPGDATNETTGETTPAGQPLPPVPDTAPFPPAIADVVTAAGITIDRVQWVRVQGSSLAVAFTDTNGVTTVGRMIALTDDEVDTLVVAELADAEVAR